MKTLLMFVNVTVYIALLWLFGLDAAMIWIIGCIFGATLAVLTD